MIRMKMMTKVSSCHSKTNYNQQRSDPPPFAALCPRKIATVLMKFDLRLRKMKMRIRREEVLKNTVQKQAKKQNTKFGRLPLC